MPNTNTVSLLGSSSQLLLAAGPRRPLTRGGRVQVWNGQYGTFLGYTRDGWLRVGLDGERTVSGAQAVSEWQRWQVAAV